MQNCLSFSVSDGMVWDGRNEKLKGREVYFFDIQDRNCIKITLKPYYSDSYYGVPNPNLIISPLSIKTVCVLYALFCFYAYLYSTTFNL